MNKNTMAAFLAAILLLESFSFRTCRAQEAVASSDCSEKLGGVRSLSRATKYGSHELVIIGMIHSLNLQENPFSSADEETKTILLEQFEQWDSLSHDVTVLFFDSTEERESAKKKWTEMAKKKKSHFPLLTTFSVLHSRSKKNGVTFVSCAPLERFEETDCNIAFFLSMTTFPQLARQAKLPASSVFAIDHWLSKRSLLEKKRFFIAGGPYAQFQDTVIRMFEIHKEKTPASLLTFDKLTAMLDYAYSLCCRLRLEAGNSYVRSHARLLARFLKRHRDDLLSYIALFDCTQPSKPLVDGLFMCIQSKMDLGKAVGEFANETTGAILRFKDFMDCASLVEEVYKAKNVLVVPHYDKVDSVLWFLNKAGFDVATQGEVSIFKPGTEITVTESPFSTVSVRKFLSSSFEGKERTQPYPLPQSSQYTEFILSSDTQEDSCKASLSTIIRPASDTKETEDTTPELCPLCKNPYLEIVSQPYLTHNENSCSFSCFFNHVLDHCSQEARALMNSKEDEQQELKKKVAALCYLRLATLSPLLIVQDSSIYNLPFDQIAQTLTTIKTNESHQWKVALTIAKGLFIDYEQLIVILRLIARSKETYATEHRQYLKQKIKKEVTEADKPLFDSHNLLGTIQAQQLQKLKAELSAQSIANHNIPRFYYRIIQMLLTTVSSADELLKPLNA